MDVVHETGSCPEAPVKHATGSFFGHEFLPVLVAEKAHISQKGGFFCRP
jgi:hypothetical protein